jgi:succinate dehydrogenase / fumarate reductase flavoprotein subunit
MKIAEKGVSVDLLSLVPVKRSHSVCAQGGINAALDTKGEGDSTAEHFDDTVYGGDFLANQPPVKRMCDAAPGIIYAMDRMGVMFTRTAEGLLDLRNFGGQKNKRTAFAGATTGAQLEYCCDEQVRKHEDLGVVKKYEGWEFLGVIKDENGVCRGCIAQNLATMEIRVFKGDAVILATGGGGMIYAKSTTSTICTGSAAGTIFQQGAYLANMEFIQIHPTTMLGDDKTRLLSESARGDGGRIWTYKDGQPWYFLEEMYPAYGNLVPRDIASRAIHKVCVDMGLGIDGQNQVFLDLSHLPAEFLDRRLGGIMEIYEKFNGDDPRKVPMKIFPGIHYFMGGIHVSEEHMTCIPGVFAAGECDYMYHGANRLGANSLLSALYSGTVCGPAALKYVKGLDRLADEVDEKYFSDELKKQEETNENIKKMNGNENPYQLHQDLGDTMRANVGIVRNNKDLAKNIEAIKEIRERWKSINMIDSNDYNNNTILFTRELKNMIEVAHAITLGALERDESRGSHYKPDFPERDDERFLKTSKSRWTDKGPVIEWEEVDTSLIKPRKRVYNVAKEVAKDGK